jgi:hypothetical protein
MVLNESEREELATFFTKRADVINVENIRVRTGISVPPSLVGKGLAEWEALLEEADTRGRLPLVASLIAEQCPQDTNLQSVCSILDDRRQRRLRQVSNYMHKAGVGLVGAGVAGIFLGIIGLGFSVSPDTSIANDIHPDSEHVIVQRALSASLQPQPKAPLQPQPKTDLQPQPKIPLQPQSKAALQPQPKTSTPAPRKPSLIQQASQHIASLQPQSVKPNRKGKLTRRCGAGPQERIGYFHWGPVADGKPTEEVLIARSVNVRAEYPNPKNQYSLSGQVRCILRQGEKLKLSEEAILVAGGHYWVPISSQDLVTI